MTQRKAIFITGGGSGIGRAIAQLFVQRGWFAGIADVDEAGIAGTAALLPAGTYSTHRLDVRDPAQWEIALADFAVAAGGNIHVLANNAGVGHGGAITELSQTQINQLIDVNVHGVINGARAAHKWLKTSGPGSCLLNMASASALYGVGGMSIYSASKFAVRSISEALDTEWEDDGINVRCLMPSFIDTPLLSQPANQHSNVSKRETVKEEGMELLSPDDVAQAAWDAIHGRRLHTMVGKTARQMALVARWAPAYLRYRSRKLMRTRLGRDSGR